MAISTYLPENNTQDVLIDVKDVWKEYQAGEPVLQGVNLQVKEREVLAIIGTSGCGKTTLLKVIAGLETPTKGQVDLAEDNFTLVFQYSALFDSLTVFENVAFSALERPDDMGSPNKKNVQSFRHLQALRDLSHEDLRKLVSEKLEMLGLSDIEDKYPNELSGGMQKRVSFARAILANPRIILYDEPTSGLDPLASKALEDCILKLRDELEAASVVVTHTISTILRAADRICLLNKGKVAWMGTRQEFLNTSEPAVIEFRDAALVKESKEGNGPFTSF